MEELKDRLRRIREDAGLAQYQLAEKAGLTASCVERIESGETRTPKIETIVAISKVLEVDPQWLLGVRHPKGNMPIARPDKRKYYLDIAAQVSERSTCIRRQYGAIIVKDDHIVSTGYNGAARGELNCCDIGKCYREQHGIPHGQQYEKCVAVHAEANAIIKASPEEMKGATLYLAGFEHKHRINDPQPCEMCKRLIKNAGIGVVITNYEDMEVWSVDKDKSGVRL